MDDELRAVLREMKPLIMRALPPVLDEFYQRVAATSEVGRMFRNRDHMAHAKQAQLNHWAVIVNGEFSDEYVTSVTRIGETHNKLGLEPRWYIGAYSFLMSGVLAAIEADGSRGWSKNAQKKANMMRAFTTAAMIDMDFAISVYLDAGKRDKREALEKLASSFDETVGGIIEAVASSATEMEATAATMTKTAELTQELSQSAAAASEQTSANVQSVASATEELAGSVSEIGRQVHRSSEIAGDAVNQASRADSRIGQLSKAADRIGDVVSLITAIADRTNLLALNATIEAARAGDAGKGFAVVAHEVKELAAQTAKATGDIVAQVDEMRSVTRDAVTAIKEISGTIAAMSEIATGIASAVEQQGAATQEISRNVHDAATGTSHVASRITEVGRGASETGAASEQVHSAAQSLSSQSNGLKSAVHQFLSTIRSA
jgi:methyl-accepting chemotaxis protein